MTSGPQAEHRADPTGTNRGTAYDGPAISKDEHEVVLREERPVLDTEAVPVERVASAPRRTPDHETVGGELRKREIELDTDTRDVRDR